MKKLLTVILVIVIPIMSIISSFVLICRTPDYYAKEFTKLKVVGNIGLSVSETEIAQMIVDYLNGKTEKFEMIAEINGEEKNIFNAKEQRHMKDVKGLVGFATILLMILLIGVIAIYYYLLEDKERQLIRVAYSGSAVFYGVILVLLGIVSLVDFNAGFTVFHELFFRNELWILDPSKDVLLMLMPLQFFIDALKISLIISAIIMAAGGILTWRVTKVKGMFS